MVIFWSMICFFFEKYGFDGHILVHEMPFYIQIYGFDGHILVHEMPFYIQIYGFDGHIFPSAEYR
jgi:hypothetical protein